jgi:hypothetical protein
MFLTLYMYVYYSTHVFEGRIRELEDYLIQRGTQVCPRSTCFARVFARMAKSTYVAITVVSHPTTCSQFKNCI